MIDWNLFWVGMDFWSAVFGEIMGLVVVIGAGYLFYKKILKKIWRKA
jgi:hypothetical protein